MLAASVDIFKRLLVQKANKTVLSCDILHDLHGELVLVGCKVSCSEDRCHLVLSGRNLVVLCLSKNAVLP